MNSSKATTLNSAEDLLAMYKRHPFAEGLLPFRSALKASRALFPKFCAKQDGRQRWLICDTATGLPTLFSHAAVFVDGDPMETGNYIPQDEVVPAGIEVKTVQRRANSRCFYTYVFDTYADLSLYEGQWSLDEYMSKVKGFNPTNLPRRPYLSGLDARYRNQFWMQTPMFLRSKTVGETMISIEHLHPWVVQADRESKMFRANPDRPRVWVKDGDNTLAIGEREPGTLQRGDVVALSFTVTYHITSSNWFPQFHPADIVVLKAGDGDAMDYSAPMIDLYSRPAPAFGTVNLADDDSDVDIGAEAANNGIVVGPIDSGPSPTIVGGALIGSEFDGKDSGDDMVDVQDNVVPIGRRSSDTLGSTGDDQDAIEGEFEVLTSGGGGDDVNPHEEFVDVAIPEQDVRASHGGNGKSGQYTRKRP